MLLPPASSCLFGKKMREGNLLAARDLEAVQAPLQGWLSGNSAVSPLFGNRELARTEGDCVLLSGKPLATELIPESRKRDSYGPMRRLSLRAVSCFVNQQI